MHLNDLEEIVVRELRSLCSNCLYRNTCSYRNTTKKVIIQCELHVLDLDTSDDAQPKGLCKSCDTFNSCKLPGKNTGVWHCQEFK